MGATRATAVQRAEIARLHQQGHSIRAIASQVFGGSRYRGRVERILAATPEPARLRRGHERPAAPDLTDLPPHEMLRALLEWRLAFWAVSAEPPSLSQLETLLRLQQRLATIEQQQRRLQATTRGSQPPTVPRPTRR